MKGAEAVNRFRTLFMFCLYRDNDKTVISSGRLSRTTGHDSGCRMISPTIR